MNYEYITDEKWRWESAEEGRRTGCQPFIRDIIREDPTLVIVEGVQWLNRVR